MTRVPENLQDGGEALRRENMLLRESLRQAHHVQRMYDGSVRSLKAAKQALAKSGLFKSTILSMMLDGLICMDDAGRIVEFNTAAERIFGCKQEDALGRDLIDLIIPPRLREKYNRGLSWYLKTREEYFLNKPLETIARRADGSEFPIEVSITETSHDGEKLFTCILRDVSTRKQAEAQLRQAQKMEALGTLVGGIAHDFNNTLAGMTGNLYLARKGLADRPEVMAKLRTVEQLGFRAAEMISQLLTFARKGVIRMQPFSLNPFAKEALKLAQVSIPENIKLRRSFCSYDLKINGDATQLQQVLMNLLSNARDALRDVKKPEITVKLRDWRATAEFADQHPEISANRFAWLTVEDNGCGIPEDYLDKIFDPFFTSKGVGEGTGLGLAMTYGAVQSHGGILAVESEVGEGARFHVYLPLLDDTTVSSDSPNEARGNEPLTGHGEMILLADDQANVRTTVKDLLVSLNYHVLEAANGREAVETFSVHSGKISLLLLDVIMPELGGVEAARSIREITPDIPAIFATGYDQEQVLSEPMPHTLVLTKPFSIGALSQSLSTLLKKE